MPDRHRDGPLCFRPFTDSDREWLLAHAQHSGRSLNAILAEALAVYRQRVTKRSGRVPLAQRRDSS